LTLGPANFQAARRPNTLQEERKVKSQSFGSPFFPNANSHFAFLRQQIKDVKNTLPRDFGITHPQISLSPTFFGSDGANPFVFQPPPTSVKPFQRTRQQTVRPTRPLQETEKEIQKLDQFEEATRTLPALPEASKSNKNSESHEIRLMITAEEVTNDSLDIHIPVMIEEAAVEDPGQAERLTIADGLHVFGPTVPQVSTRGRGRGTTVATSSVTTTLTTTATVRTTTTTTTTRAPPMTAIRGEMEFRSSAEDLQERIRKLKETVRRTKESLTANRVVKLGAKKKRKRVRGRKRVVQNLRQAADADKRLTIVYPENVNLPTFAEQRPHQGAVRASGGTSESSRSRGRGRLRRPPQQAARVCRKLPSWRRNWRRNMAKEL
jgi:hypothetical protein